MILNNVISDNVTISTETDTTDIFSKNKYFIAYHNFNSNLYVKLILKIKFLIKIECSRNKFLFKKNKENYHNFCNKKYSFSDNSINKDCFINKIWKINYNNYNATYD